jgi:phospholipase D3/4
VPGWQDTTGSSAVFPAFSRVNHAKYVVTDRRANVGTSNMQWGYYYNTAGASFNTDDALFVATVQAAFDRDWASSYATPLDLFEP